MMNGGAKIFLFLSVIAGVFLLAFIGSNVMNVYKVSMTNIEDESENLNLNCMQFSFDVELVINGKILLKIMNSKLSSYELSDVVLEFGENKTHFTYKRFASGDEKIEDITGFNITDTFKVYPAGCSTRAIDCSLVTGVCKSAKIDFST